MRRPDWRDALWSRVRTIRVDRRWIAVAAVVALLLLNFLFTAEYERHSEAAFSHQQAEQQAIQRRAGELVERELCADVGTMAAIPPPAGAAASNPSRAYEQAEHRTWRDLAVRVLDCKHIPTSEETPHGR